MDRRGIGVAGATIVGMAMFGQACSTPGDDPGPALPVDPAAIYAQMCARCHGVDGRGDSEMKKTLPVRDFSDPTFQGRATSDEVARILMAGKNQMPAFGGLLSPPKIQSLSGYVLRLGRTVARVGGPPNGVPGGLPRHAPNGPPAGSLNAPH